MLPTPEETEAILMEPAANDALQQLKSIFVITYQAVGNILEAEDTGQIDADVAEEAIEDVLAHQLELQAIALSLSLEDIDEDVDRIIEVGSPAEHFAEAFVALIGAEHDSFEDGLAMVSEHTGIDQDTLLDYANNRALPSQDEAMAIGSCFGTCQDDPSAMEHLVALADDGMADYARDRQSLTAEFAAIAREREAIKQEAATAHRLKAVERMADDVYSAGFMTPDQRRRIMPSGIEADERANFSAFFSQAAQKLGTTAERHLDNIEFCLNFLASGEKLNPMLMADFASYDYAQAEPLDRANELALREYRQRKSYG
jgi:hypothetical protein